MRLIDAQDLRRLDETMRPLAGLIVNLDEYDSRSMPDRVAAPLIEATPQQGGPALRREVGRLTDPRVAQDLAAHFACVRDILTRLRGQC